MPGRASERRAEGGGSIARKTRAPNTGGSSSDGGRDYSYAFTLDSPIIKILMEKRNRQVGNWAAVGCRCGGGDLQHCQRRGTAAGQVASTMN